MKKSRLNFHLLIAAVLLTAVGFTQVSSYSFNQSAGTYTAISGGTVLGTTTSDDQRFIDPAIPAGGTVLTGVGFPIGFNFVFNGTTYDRFAVNNNGWISLGQSTLVPAVNITSSSSYTPISATTTGALSSRIAGFARNLAAQAGSNLRFETIGTAPNRTLVVQWTNYRRLSGVGNDLNFQIRLNETSNVVEVVYGSITTTETTNYTIQVGLRGITNADFNHRSVINGTNTWATSAAGILNSATCSFTNVFTPNVGLTYRWTPSTCMLPNTLSSSNISSNSADLAWVSAASGAEWMVSVVPFGSPANSATQVSSLTESMSLSGLNAGTQYSYYVREVCGPGDTSNWAGPSTFTTLCNPFTPGDTQATAIAVNTTTYSATGTNAVCFTNTIGNTSPDVWYLVYLDPCATNISASLCTGTNYDSYLRIYAADFTQLAFNDDGCGAQSVINNLSVFGYDSVYVVVEGFGSGVGNYTLNLTQTIGSVIPPDGLAVQTICESGSLADLVLNGTNIKWYDAATSGTLLASNSPVVNGISYFATQTIDGCESPTTFEVNVSLIPTTTEEQIISNCISYTWSNGVTYYQSNNTAFQTLTNIAGCDSIITLNLTINSPSTGVDIQEACGSYTWIDGVTYTSNNTSAVFTIPSSTGCDSTLTLMLTVNSPSTGTDVQVACGSYTWIDGNNYTSSNNSATFLLTNFVGCDSLVTLDLTILNTTSGTDVLSACGSYTWIDGNTYTTSNNTATFMETNAAGCDSLVTLNLTINALPIATITDNGNGSLSSSTGTSYQWIDCLTGNDIVGANAQTYTTTVNGEFAVTITNASNCFATSECVIIDNLDVKEIEDASILVYPNPTNGEVTVTMNIENARFEVIDAQGKILNSNRINSGSKLDFSAYENGIYFLKIYSENASFIERIVKN